MLGRRTVTALLASAIAAPAVTFAQAKRAQSVFYNAVGPTLTCWHADIDAASLDRQGSVTLPALIQYAWRHPTKPVLYVASSNFVPMGNPDGKHHLTAFHIDPATGALTMFGDPVPIRARPINITVDQSGAWLLTAYNLPSSMTVHRINPDGSIGEENETVGGDRWRHLRTSDPHVSVERRADPRHARQQRHGREAGRSRCAEGEGSQGRAIDRHRIDRARRRLRLRPASRRFPSDKSMDVRLGGAAEPASGLSSARRQSGTAAGLYRNDTGGARQSAAGADGGADPCASERQGRLSGQPRRRIGRGCRARRLPPAARTPSPPSASTRPRDSRPWCRPSTRTASTRALSSSIPPGRMLVVANLTALPVRDGDSIRTQPATLSTYPHRRR